MKLGDFLRASRRADSVSRPGMYELDDARVGILDTVGVND